MHIIIITIVVIVPRQHSSIRRRNSSTHSVGWLTADVISDGPALQIQLINRARRGLLHATQPQGLTDKQNRTYIDSVSVTCELWAWFAVRDASFRAYRMLFDRKMMIMIKETNKKLASRIFGLRVYLSHSLSLGGRSSKTESCSVNVGLRFPFFRKVTQNITLHFANIGALLETVTFGDD